MSNDSDQYLLANLSSQSSVILSGRCTSTPKGISRVCITCPELSFEKIESKTAKETSSLTLNPKIFFAPVPIFGRRNLQLLSNCVNEATAPVSDHVAGSTLQKKEKNVQFLAKPNVNNTLLDNPAKKESSKLGSSIVTDHFKRQIKKNKNKELKDCANTISTKRRSISTKKTTHSATKKRRSTHESQIPVFKVTPKCPKSPRLLTSMRAKIRLHRERMSREHEKATLASNNSKSPIYIKQSHAYAGKQSDKKLGTSLPKCTKSSSLRVTTPRTGVKTNSKIPKLIQSERIKARFIECPNPSTLSKIPRENSKTLYEEFHVEDKSTKRKACTTTEIVKRHIQCQREDLKKRTAFKAQPIRVYSPVQPMKKRKITIPESPKLGKRRRLDTCPPRY